MGKVFATRFAPETEPFELAKPLDGGKQRWAAQPLWSDGTVNRIGAVEFAAYYVTRTITASSARRVKVYLGSDLPDSRRPAVGGSGGVGDPRRHGGELRTDPPLLG